MDSYGPAHCVPPPFNIPRSAPAHPIQDLAGEVKDEGLKEL